MCVCVHLCASMCAFACVCAFACLCAFACARVCMCLCVGWFGGSFGDWMGYLMCFFGGLFVFCLADCLFGGYVCLCV